MLLRGHKHSIDLFLIVSPSGLLRWKRKIQHPQNKILILIICHFSWHLIFLNLDILLRKFQVALTIKKFQTIKQCIVTKCNTLNCVIHHIQRIRIECNKFSIQILFLLRPTLTFHILIIQKIATSWPSVEIKASFNLNKTNKNMFCFSLQIFEDKTISI